MKVCIEAPDLTRQFHLVHPASVFALAGQSALPASRNVWMRITEPNSLKAINLHSGIISEFLPNDLCQLLPDAKVVVL